ncbi:putative nuclease HARBI1 [Hyperolius riggenbachi]|uniref:putative nuclease HARBI1 n=1 Tax=Hyperolius riggenbachi TaxID=752182 RepID=UPI0035A29065
MSEGDRLRCAVALLCVAEHNRVAKQRKAKRQWAKGWLQKRNHFDHMALIQELRENNPEDFRNYMRMTDASYNHLLERLRSRITKQDTVMRAAITAEQRLSVTLRFLATGRSYADLKFTSAISPQALSCIIPETCQAIVSELMGEYMKLPESAAEWQLVAEDFNTMWNFPNCGGALDGKHVRINPPPKSGSYYYNYKRFFSVVMMALVNARYEFLMVDVGKNGRISDGGVMEETEFNRRLKNNELSLPTNAETVGNMNYVFVADEAFALGEHLVKPYPQRGLDRGKRIFNYRLSRARRVVENAFGILAQRFRIFLTTINLEPSKVQVIVLAACTLHNYLRRQTPHHYCPPNSVDQEDIQTGTIVEGEWRSGPNMSAWQPMVGHNSTTLAKRNRDQYMNYFCSTGAVSWQDRMVMGTQSTNVPQTVASSQ